MKEYKSLNDLIKSSQTSSNLQNIKSLKSLKSLKTYTQYMKSKTDNKNYLYKFFKKSDLTFEKSAIYNFELYVLPINYFLWKGIDPGVKYDSSINDNSFFANKEVAAHYGTKKKKKGVAGTDLQFKIINEIKLIDIGNLSNVIKIFKILDKITYDDLNDDSNNFHKYLKTNFIANVNTSKYDKTEFLSKCIEMYKELLIETIANYALNFEKKIKTPTRCERKSCEWFDDDLANFFKSFDDQIDGWIHFHTEMFHDEILLFDVKKHLKFIDYHLI